MTPNLSWCRIIHEHRCLYFGYFCCESCAICGNSSVIWYDPMRFVSPPLFFMMCSLGLSAIHQAPRFLSWTTKSGIPLPSLLATSSISILCFGSSYIGNGQLWNWIQNIVGVSNQIAWFSIGLASWRFRKAWISQGRSLDDMKFRAAWTWPWAPSFVVRESHNHCTSAHCPNCSCAGDKRCLPDPE